MKVGELLRRLFKFCLLFVLAAEVASAQDSIDPLVHPGNRFARENVQSQRLAHWVGSVEVQFVGIRDPEIQKTVLTEVLSLGAAANVNLDIFGFPGSMFGEITVDDKARIVLVQFESEYEARLSSGADLSSGLGDINLINANTVIESIFSKGLVQQAEGCFARWEASNSNEIRGIVIAASNSLSAESRRRCFKTLLPTAFGISPVLSRYNASEAIGGQGNTEPVIFEDRSELILALSAAAACRESLDDFDANCPFRLVNNILSHHGYLSLLEVK